MLLLTCPNCGPRNAAEFRHGGEAHARPKAGDEISEAAWTDFLYMKDNVSDLQTEWWYHRAGCGLWFLADRHNYTNEVLRTYLWAPKAPARPEPDADTGAQARPSTMAGEP